MFQESPFTGACAHSTWEVLLMLVGTFLLGLLLGYLIWGWVRSRLREARDEIEKLTGELAKLQVIIDDQKEKLSQVESELKHKTVQLETQLELIRKLRRELTSREHELDLRLHEYRRMTTAALSAKHQLSTQRAQSGTEPQVPDVSSIRDEKETGPVANSQKSAEEHPVVIPEVRAETGEDAASDTPSVTEHSEESLKIASGIFGRKVRQDSLQLIEGIGPKIEELLIHSGIRTWAKLSRTSEMVLRVILDEGGTQFRAHKPKTWPRQAQMAQAGEWKKLKAYQDMLIGGKEQKSGEP